MGGIGQTIMANFVVFSWLLMLNVHVKEKTFLAFLAGFVCVGTLVMKLIIIIFVLFKIVFNIVLGVWHFLDIVLIYWCVS